MLSRFAALSVRAPNDFVVPLPVLGALISCRTDRRLRDGAVTSVSVRRTGVATRALMLKYKPMQYILKLFVLPCHVVAAHTCTSRGFLTVFDVCLLLAFMTSAYFIVYCEARGG